MVAPAFSASSAPHATVAIARSHSLASAVKPHRSRMSVVSLRHHRPTAEDTPIPLRLRSSSLITSPASPFSKRSLTPPQLKRVNSLPGV